MTTIIPVEFDNDDSSEYTFVVNVGVDVGGVAEDVPQNQVFVPSGEQ